MRYRFMLLVIAISLALCTGRFAGQQVWAGDRESEHEARDEDRARQALERGEILPLDQVIARLRDAVPGEVSGVELEKENGIWVYEFKVISAAGRMNEVRIDAKTGKLTGKAGE